MARTSVYLDAMLATKNPTCNMQVVFVDIVSYSQRQPHAQVSVIRAFMDSLREALKATAQQYIDDTSKKNLLLMNDLAVLPAGDGAAIGFPFEGFHDIHLSFACHLFRIVDRINRDSHCESFREHNWCNCHDAFLLRCGISEGKMILYKDLNDNYNIAGEAINMASRVMGLAGPGQVFFTQDGYKELEDWVPGVDQKFRKYTDVVIKHNLRINVYQYTAKGQKGLDVSAKADLGLSEVVGHTQDRAMTPEVSSGIKQSPILRKPFGNKKDAGTSTSDTRTPNRVIREMRGRMVTIPAGTFTMGDEQTGRSLVKIPQPFLIDKYPMTQGIYEQVMNTNPSHFKGADRPVENVSWADAIAFCNALSRLSGLEPVYDILGKEVSIDLGKNGYRLPTEAE
jgi:class 3 adenylate cyclase